MTVMCVPLNHLGTVPVATEWEFDYPSQCLVVSGPRPFNTLASVPGHVRHSTRILLLRRCVMRQDMENLVPPGELLPCMHLVILEDCEWRLNAREHVPSWLEVVFGTEARATSGLVTSEDGVTDVLWLDRRDDSSPDA